MRKLLPTLAILALSLSACSGGTPQDAPAAASPSPSATASPSSLATETEPPAPTTSSASDVETIETAAPASEALTEEEVAALPANLAEIYNQCMVDEWQRSLDDGTEYDEGKAARFCVALVDFNDAMEGVTQEQFEELSQCLAHMEKTRPELLEGYDSWFEALEQQELKEACWEYMGMM